MTWRDESTLRGKLEAAIDPVISGGATEAQIDRTVDRLLELVANGGNPNTTAAALKRALLNQLPKKDETLSAASLESRLHNLRLIVSCDSWST